MAVQYTAIRTANQTARREAKAQISSPARESLNAKLSWEKLMLILAANFRRSDLVVGLDYREEALPKRREDADRKLTNFISALRSHRKQLGQELVYVRVTEGYHSGGRLHHHLIVNATGNDYEIIRKLWYKNADTVDFEPFGSDGPERWAMYLTKEPREKGRRYVGDRTWRCSIHMRKPIVTSELVDSRDTLEPPLGSFVVDRTCYENCYGRFAKITAVLPESPN